MSVSLVSMIALRMTRKVGVDVPKMGRLSASLLVISYRYRVVVSSGQAISIDFVGSHTIFPDLSLHDTRTP